MNILPRIKAPATLTALILSTLICGVFLPTSSEGDDFFGKVAIVLETDTADAL